MPTSSSYSRIPTHEDVEPFQSANPASTSSYPPAPRSTRFPLSPPTHSSDADLPYSVVSSEFSRKLKGKARATDDFFRSEEDELTSERSSAPPRGLNFCIRFTDGTTEDILDLYVTERETVRDVKKRVSRPKEKRTFNLPLSSTWLTFFVIRFS